MCWMFSQPGELATVCQLARSGCSTGSGTRGSGVGTRGNGVRHGDVVVWWVPCGTGPGSPTVALQWALQWATVGLTVAPPGTHG